MTGSPVNYPVENIPFLYKYGLNVHNTGRTINTKISIGPGVCRDSLNVADIRFGDFNPGFTGKITSAPVRIDNTVTGKGGLDEGTVLPNTMYAVYIIADSRGYLPISAIATLGINIYAVHGPVMPAGYDLQRVVGFWPTDSNSHWIKGNYFGAGNDLTFIYDTPQATAITAGASTTYAYVPLSALVPFVNNIPVSIYSVFHPGVAGDTLTLASGVSTNPLGQATITGQVSSIPITTISTITCNIAPVADPPYPVSVAIQYKVSGSDTAAIFVAGFSVNPFSIRVPSNVMTPT